jgi:hypothetical protein
MCRRQVKKLGSDYDLPMSESTEAPRHETYRTAGYVVTRGCVFRPELDRWEPQVSIRAAHDPGAAAVTLTAKPEHFQDTPDDAYGVALDMATAWIEANPRDDGTVDGAA